MVLKPRYPELPKELPQLQFRVTECREPQLPLLRQ